MDRRKVLYLFGFGWFASMVPSTLANVWRESFGKNSIPEAAMPSTTGSLVIANQGSRVVGSVTQLNQNGQLIANGVIVIRDRQNSKNLFAVNPICPHKGCDVKWQKDTQEFFCPCHDARFAKDGKVLQAPVKQPLATYAVWIEKDQVVIGNQKNAALSSNTQGDSKFESDDEDYEECKKSSKEQ